MVSKFLIDDVSRVRAKQVRLKARYVTFSATESKIISQLTCCGNNFENTVIKSIRTIFALLLNRHIRGEYPNFRYLFRGSMTDMSSIVLSSN